MKKYIGLLAAGLILFPANLAYAEEIVEEPVVVEEPAAEPEPEPEPAPEPEPTYTPPPEASEGVGGWSIVDKKTGNVVSGTVCTIDVCGPDGEWGGVLPDDVSSGYGCEPGGCVFRFQSKASEDGNVAGYSSGGGNSVTWNETEKNFSITDGLGRTSTLIPERTDGRGVQSGLVDIVTKSTTDSGVEITEEQEDIYDEEIETKVLFPEWGVSGKLFSYGSKLQADSNLKSDVDNELIIEGYTKEQTTSTSSISEETGEEVTTEVTETVIDEENTFVRTVRQWTESVFNFFRGIFS